MLHVLLFNCDPLTSTTIELLVTPIDDIRLVSNLPTPYQPENSEAKFTPDVVVMGGVNGLR